MIIPVNIIESETNKIDKATNGLQFSTCFVIKIVLFCLISTISSYFLLPLILLLFYVHIYN